MGKCGKGTGSFGALPVPAHLAPWVCVAMLLIRRCSFGCQLGFVSHGRLAVPEHRRRSRLFGRPFSTDCIEPRSRRRCKLCLGPTVL